MHAVIYSEKDRGKTWTWPSQKGNRMDGSDPRTLCTVNLICTGQSCALHPKDSFIYSSGPCDGFKGLDIVPFMT